jgi:hypothetical protein
MMNREENQRENKIEKNSVEKLFTLADFNFSLAPSMKKRK